MRPSHYSHMRARESLALDHLHRPAMPSCQCATLAAAVLISTLPPAWHPGLLQSSKSDRICRSSCSLPVHRDVPHAQSRIRPSQRKQLAMHSQLCLYAGKFGCQTSDGRTRASASNSAIRDVTMIQVCVEERSVPSLLMCASIR
ncbi:hypothetical protein OH77DRAFT_127231 [Trametes cingulata]|nr:hypothetical protein OH77DRAFT_127231 [Trametes cingulata]